MKQKITVKIGGTCPVNPNGEMHFAYMIEYQNGDVESYVDVVEEKFGKSLNTAEYKALNSALEKLIELNLTKNEIEVQTTSSNILMHHMNIFKPNQGFYLKEAIRAQKNFKRFLDISIIKIYKPDNAELMLLIKK